MPLLRIIECDRWSKQKPCKTSLERRRGRRVPFSLKRLFLAGRLRPARRPDWVTSGHGSLSALPLSGEDCVTGFSPSTICGLERNAMRWNRTRFHLIAFARTGVARRRRDHGSSRFQLDPSCSRGGHWESECICCHVRGKKKASTCQSHGGRPRKNCKLCPFGQRTGRVDRARAATRVIVSRSCATSAGAIGAEITTFRPSVVTSIRLSSTALIGPAALMPLDLGTVEFAPRNAGGLQAPTVENAFVVQLQPRATSHQLQEGEDHEDEADATDPPPDL